MKLFLPYLSEFEVAGNMCTPSGFAGTCLGGARYAGFDPLGRPSPRALLADTLTKYGSPVCSSVMVYHKEDELVAAPPSPTDAEDDTNAGMVVDWRVVGLLPRTEVPKSTVTGEVSVVPAYAWPINSDNSERLGGGIATAGSSSTQVTRMTDVG